MLHCCSHHVAQPHSMVVGIVLHQRVVMCGEERAATDLLGQLLHDSAGNGRAVICGCAPSCEQFTAEWLRATKINCVETELPLPSTAVRKMAERTETNLPNSSRSTRECLVAWCRMLAVSLSSTKKVLSPGEHMMDNTGLARKGKKKHQIMSCVSHYRSTWCYLP